jgi:hypothetical protein
MNDNVSPSLQPLLDPIPFEVIGAAGKPFIDREVADRKAAGNDWPVLQALSNELHAALKLVRP